MFFLMYDWFMSVLLTAGFSSVHNALSDMCASSRFYDRTQQVCALLCCCSKNIRMNIRMLRHYPCRIAGLRMKLVCLWVAHVGESSSKWKRHEEVLAMNILRFSQMASMERYESSTRPTPKLKVTALHGARLTESLVPARRKLGLSRSSACPPGPASQPHRASTLTATVYLHLVLSFAACGYNALRIRRGMQAVSAAIGGEGS